MHRFSRSVLGAVVGAGLAIGALAPSAGAAKDADPTLSVDPTFGTNGIASVPLSATEADRFLGATASGSSLFAVGFATTGGDQAMTVTKLTAKGQPDPTFGTAGTATVNVAVGGKTVELARSVVVQADGKVVIGGPVEHDPKGTGDAARDVDIALVRFTRTGQLDTTYGTNGIARFDLSPGVVVNATTFRTETAWGLAGAQGDSVIVSASAPTKAAGRTDTDIVFFKVDESGQLDTGFATSGYLTYDQDGLVENVRHVRASSDGKRFVGTGYVANAQGVVMPFFLKFDANGKLDRSFGSDGIVDRVAFLDSVAESYTAIPQGSSVVFTGYGRSAGETKVDLFTSRVTAKGAKDAKYGTAEGVARLDIAKDDDRGRDLAITTGGLVVAVGSGKPDATNLNGLIAAFDKNGKALKGFATNGYLLQDLGGINDAFFGVAALPDGGVLVVGYRGEATGGNDQAVAMRLTTKQV